MPIQRQNENPACKKICRFAAFAENAPPANAFDTPKNLEKDASPPAVIGGLNTALGVAGFTSLKTFRAFTLNVML